MKLKLVLDTNILVTALTNSAGASHLLLRWILENKLTFLASPALWLEYEDVLKRPEVRLRHGISLDNLNVILDTLAAHVVPVHLDYLWRPQLRDPKDEMVLETALNGRADALVTFNTRDFAKAADQFRLKLMIPAEALHYIGGIP